MNKTNSNIRIKRFHGIYFLEAKQEIPVSRSKAWDYFSRPANLNELTPPDMNFRIVSKTTEEMYAGQIITYRIRLMPGFVSTWVTEITQVTDSRYFIDEQRKGPYRMWHHEHRFEETGGSTLMTDRLVFIPPFGIIGDILFRMLFLKSVRRIFTYRQQKLMQIFPS